MAQEFSRKFYKSKEWGNFRKIILAERGPVCQQCKKIIRESKHIQLHHKEELTPTNVTDVNITLNPDNIEVLCQECHNKLHGRWCKGQTIKKKDKGVYIVYGPPLSGKTSYVLENMNRGDIVVDMDRLYQAVTLLPRYDKPDNLKYNVLSIRNIILDNIKTRYGGFKSAWIVGGYADKYSREQLARELGAELIFIDVDKEECLYRLRYCNDYRQNKDEWISYIEKWFEKYTK
ncbi:HNH endonuclease [Clostridium sporogenes]|uniref:Putative HNH nuclease YajD n=1 Tax=Clostridium sporogenes TaxID=1509 RepID=A0AAE4FMX4_CLOSG|nr:HNH endonuclease [Clostridium sporogenes]MDS1005308.1 HNH endonuclease [Clostridium sporogenes]